MKKVFDRRVLVKFAGDKEWTDTSIWIHLDYDHEEIQKEDFTYHLDTFQKAYDFIKNGYLRNAETDETFFRHRPQIRINIARLSDGVITYTEKSFKPFDVKIVYEDASHISLSTLSEKLRADDFCQYLKDRNIPYTKF